MKLLQIKYFYTVCRCGSITKAAEKLFVSQPTISFCIKELEDEFGLKLFQRKHGRMVLTVEGQFFLEKAKYILQATDVLEKQMRDMATNRSHVKIAVPAMISTFLFPEMFHAFEEKYPGVQLEMLETGSLQTRKLIDANAVDLGITIRDNAVNDNYNVLPLVTTELVFCVNKDHHLAKCDKISFSQLDNEKLILFKADSYQNVIIQSAFARARVEPQIVLYSSQLYTIKRFLECGNAGAFLYRQVAEEDKDIVCIPLEDPIEQKIVLIWAKNGILYSATDQFISFAKQYIQK